MNIRVIASSFRQQGIQFLADPQWIIPSIIAPFMFTIVALYMYGDVSGPVVLQAVLGGGVLGMWGNMLYSSGFSIRYDRYNGTMEPIMITPTSMINVTAGRAVWNTFIGLLNAALVFIAAEFIFSVGVSVKEPLLFFGMLLLTLGSLASIGLMFSAMFILTRSSYVVMTILEFPIYLFSGALFPISALGPLAPISYVLAPSWGVDAMKIAAVDGYQSMTGFGIAGNIGMMIALMVTYILIAMLMFKRIERNIRETGGLTRY